MVKRKTATEWKQIITDCKSSGITAKNWCETNCINLSTYKYWQTTLNKLENTETAISWCEMRIPAVETSNHTKVSCITLRYEGFSIDVSDLVETQILAEILKTLRSIC